MSEPNTLALERVDQWVQIIGLIHAALKVVENSATRDSDEMAAEAVLRCARDTAEKLYGNLSEDVPRDPTTV